MRRVCFLLFLAVILSVPARTWAAPPNVLRYQGFLTDKDGTPVEGEWVVTFKLYETKTAVLPFFEETKVVHPIGGVFSVLLGAQQDNPLPPEPFTKGTVHLGLTVNGGDGPVELLPRQRVVSHPYALLAGAAASCDQATNALSLGGVGASSYVKVSELPQLCVTLDALPELLAQACVTPDSLEETLEQLGYEKGQLTLEDVQAWLELSGYAPGPYFSGAYADLEGKPDLSVFATKDEIAGLVKPEDLAPLATKEELAGYATLGDIAELVTGPQCIDAVVDSGEVLLADGSVGLEGDLDVGGHILANLALMSCPDPEAIEEPVAGMVCFNPDESNLVLFDGQAWVGVGGSVTDVACDGCVGAEDVEFTFAAADKKGGAAVNLKCFGCVEPEEVAFVWAAGVTPGGDAVKSLLSDKAFDVDCVGCISKSEIAPGVLSAGNVVYDDTKTKLAAADVQAAIEQLHKKIGSGGGGGEGHGQTFMQVREWNLAPYGKARTYLHLFNPEAKAKVIAYLYADEIASLPGEATHVYGPIQPNVYTAVTGSKGTTNLTVANPELMAVNTHVLIHQTVGSGAGAWEVNQIVGFQGKTATMLKPLANDYTTGAQAVIAVNFGQLIVDVGGDIQAAPFDESSRTGGILYIRAESVVVKAGGKISAVGAGYKGGSSDGMQGSSECKAPGGVGTDANCSGGGGSSKGGGGGGNKTAGEGVNGGGQGGAAKGDAQFNTLHMGGGGGMGNGPGAGGAGGGIIVVGASKFVVEEGGVVTAAGQENADQVCCQYGWTYGGHNLCGKSATVNSQANTPPVGCDPYIPNTGWGQNDFVQICQKFMSLFGGPTSGCTNVDTDSDGGLCSNYPAILGMEKESNPDVWLHSGTFTWKPWGGDCDIVNQSESILVYACNPVPGFGCGGGGAGGTVLIYADTFVNNGTVTAAGGESPNGGAGGEGWVANKPPIPGVVHAIYPKGVAIVVDDVDVTAAIGDPNSKGSPAWDAANKLWGETGTKAWSTGMLDLSAVANWTLGEHRVELKETGGVGGNLKLFLYTVYPFTQSAPPSNDTCLSPTQIFVTQPDKYSGTTEDVMGKLKASDDYSQPACGGSQGLDVVYTFTVQEYSQVQFDVLAAFDARLYLRESDCAAGALVACGKKQLKTEVLKPGKYFLFVDSDSAQEKGDFILQVTPLVPAPPANDTCAAPTVLDVSGGPALAQGLTLFAKNDYAADCGGAEGKDVVFQFTVPMNAKKVNILVEADFDLVMYLKKQDCEGGAIVCVPGKSYSMQWPAVGTYYLVLDGVTAKDAGEYNVTVTVQ